MKFSLYKIVSTLTMSVLLAGGSYVGYRWLRSDIAAGVYRDRLEAVAADFESLRGRYNDAVRRSAVTELVVKGGTVAVEVRVPDPTGVTGGHTLRRIDTPVNPAREVFVDYVVLGGRLLIRRIFDSATPPDHAFTLDPALAAVDWSDPQACHGTTIYRKLEEGRWVISVTGNGALGLSRVQGAEPTALVESPTVRDFTEELRKIDTKIAELGLDDVWERISK